MKACSDKQSTACTFISEMKRLDNTYGRILTGRTVAQVPAVAFSLGERWLGVPAVAISRRDRKTISQRDRTQSHEEIGKQSHEEIGKQSHEEIGHNFTKRSDTISRRDWKTISQRDWTQSHEEIGHNLTKRLEHNLTKRLDTI